MPHIPRRDPVASTKVVVVSTRSISGIMWTTGLSTPVHVDGFRGTRRS